VIVGGRRIFAEYTNGYTRGSPLSLLRLLLEGNTRKRLGAGCISSRLTRLAGVTHGGMNQALVPELLHLP